MLYTDRFAYNPASKTLADEPDCHDPGEITDLSGNSDSKNELIKWRKNMVNHLSERGDSFVKNGELVVREKTMLYSPNYPKDNRTENERVKQWRDIYTGY